MARSLRTFLLLVFGSLLMAAPIAGRQGAPPLPPPPPANAIRLEVGNPATTPKGTGTIMGHVTDAAGGHSVRGATVLLGNGGGVLVAGNASVALGPNTPTSMTDSDGAFMFRDLPAGQFNISVQAAGYLPGGYGQRRPEGPTRGVVVADNAVVTDADVTLWKSAAISGTVFDEMGPAIQVPVRALRRTMLRGRMRLTIAASGQTDDRGMYRLYSLLPGDYLIVVPTTITSIPATSSESFWQAQASNDPPSQQQATSFMAAGNTNAAGGVSVGDQQVYTYYDRPLAPSNDETDRFAVYPTTYHPAAASPHDATTIDVASGEERQGVNVQIALTDTYRISGIVTAPDGPKANMTVRLLSASADDVAPDPPFTASTTSTDGQGRFTLLGATPGDYTLKVSYGETNGPIQVTMANGTGFVMVQPGNMPGQPAGVTLSAQADVSVADRDISGLSLMLQPGARLSGHVVFEGMGPKPTADQLARIFILLTSAAGSSAQTVVQAPDRADATGAFSTRQYTPGAYFVTPNANFPGWMLKSVIVDGKDATDRQVQLTHDENDVMITFANRLSTITGTARRTGESNADIAVAVFPADVTDWIASGMVARRARLLNPTRDGTFSAANISAGEYDVAAIDAGTLVDMQDPKDIEALARIATHVVVADGETKNVTVSVAPLR